MDLAADLRAYVAGRRDSKQEQALLRRIRALPQSERFEIFASLLKTHSGSAVPMADRAQLNHGNYVAIFKLGLADANASSIKSWMKATVGNIGWRTVICPGAFAYRTVGETAARLNDRLRLCGAAVESV